MLKLNIDPKNVNLDKVKSDLDPFVTQIFREELGKGLDKSLIDKVSFKLELTSPEAINWDDLADINTHGRDKFIETIGAYTINPESLGIDFSNIQPERIKIETVPNYFKGNIWEVAKLIIEQYGKDYYIPGIEYYKFLRDGKENWLKSYLQQQQNMIASGKPDFSKSFNNFFFFGSLMCKPSYIGQISKDRGKISLGSWSVCSFTLSAPGSMNGLIMPWLPEYNRIVLIKK